jgi:transposase InsO family protein
MGKHHREKFNVSESRATEQGELIHTDLCGPMEQLSFSGSRYMLLFKDDYSNFRTVYFIENKSQVVEKFSEFIKMTKTETGKSIRMIRSDNGTEYINEDVKKLLAKHGILQQLTVPYTAQQNGREEREFRTIMESVRSMLFDKKLEKSFWAEAANSAVYLLNRSGKSPQKNVSPFELWFGKRPNLELILHGGQFGMTVWSYIPKEKRKKLDAKSERGIFMGYSEMTKGYRIYLPEKRKIKMAREIIFEKEEIMVEPKETYVYLDIDTEDEEPRSQSKLGNSHQIDNTEETKDESEEEEEADVDDADTRPKRETKRPAHLDDYDTCFFGLDVEEPTTYEEAMNSNHSKEWEAAIQEEMQAMHDNNTWEVIVKPEKCRVIQSKFVFKVKRDENGEVNKFKCRLVAKGFQQNDVYEEIYSPVLRLNTLRSLLSIAVNEKLIIHQMDVCNAFLHGELKETVYMSLPDDKKTDNKVCKLKKAIYGLKNAPIEWYRKFNKFMIAEKYKKLETDNCLYIKKINEEILYVSIYVDDILVMGSTENEIENLKVKLKENFKMKDLGLLSYYLGINIKQDFEKEIITLSQETYLLNLLKKFKMTDCNPVSTPIEPGLNLNDLKRNNSESAEIENECRKIIAGVGTHGANESRNQVFYIL